MDTTLFLAASAAVNRFTEFVKPRVRALPWATDVQDSILVAISVLAGILLAIGGKLDLVTSFVAMPDLLAQIITGFALGMGADFLNVILDLFYGWKNNVTKKASRAA